MHIYIDYKNERFDLFIAKIEECLEFDTYKTWKAVQLPILSGILPVKLLFLTSL